MSASTKLSNSVKALCFLVQHSPVPQSSSTISQHTGINASKIRKLFSHLAKTGIVTTTRGTSGGFVLGREPAKIDLQEIYCAIEDRKAFHLDVSRLNFTGQREASAVNGYFQDLFAEIQVDIEDKMRNISLASIVREVQGS